MVVPTDGTEGAGEFSEAVHVEGVVAGGEEDLEGGLGGRGCVCVCVCMCIGGVEDEAAEGFEADDTLWDFGGVAAHVFFNVLDHAGGREG